MIPIAATDLPALYTKITWLAFLLAFAFGAIAQRSHFCIMGAIADAFNFGDKTRLRQWMLALGIALIGTQTLSALGLIDTTQSLYAQPRLAWLGHLLGGTLFGFGMVLAGGCVNRNLVRLGSGNLRALVVVLVVGLTAFMALRGFLGVFRVNLVEPFVIEFASAQDLPTLLANIANTHRSSLQWVLGLGVGGALLAYALMDRAFLTLDNVAAGLIIGGAVAGLWFVSGSLGYLPEHPETLEAAFVRTNSGHMESFSFVAPVAYTLDWLLFFSDTHRVITLGIATVFGVVLGSMAMALSTGQFRMEGFSGADDTAHHLIGATLMGTGGVLALGCTVGQGLSGLSTLAVGSFISVAGIVLGALIALKYQVWRVARMP